MSDTTRMQPSDPDLLGQIGLNQVFTAQPAPGSVVRCNCGCENVHVRAQDGNWLHVRSIRVGDPTRNKNWWIDGLMEGDTHEVLHNEPETTAPASTPFDTAKKDKPGG